MSRDPIIEDVPRFTRRIGDRIIEGSNNSTMIFGTDRPGGAGTGYGRRDHPSGGVGSGTWHVVVGRSSEDPSFDSDRAFIYLSMRTDVDSNLSITGVESERNDVSAAVVKADSVRVVAREDVKIAVGKAYVYVSSDGTIVLDGPNIRLGKNATERLVRGNAFMKLYNSHQHPSPVGPTGPPVIQMTERIHLSSRSVFVR